MFMSQWSMQERATQKHSILFWDSSELGITATPFGPGCWKIKVARKWMNTQPGYVLIIIFMNNCCYRYLSCFHGRFSFFLFGGSFCFLCLPHYLVIWQFHSVNALISRNNKARQVNNIHYFVKMVLSKGWVIKHKAGSKQSDVEVEVDMVHVMQAGQLRQRSKMAGLVECFLYTVVSTYKTLEKGGELMDQQNGQRLICAVWLDSRATIEATVSACSP